MSVELDQGSLAEPATRSLQLDLRKLAEEASGYAKAEITYQKARVGSAVGQIPGIAIFGVIAFLFVFFALGGLVVGLILALAPWLTAWGSTAIVCAALLIGAAICLLQVRRRWRAVSAIFADGADL